MREIGKKEYSREVYQDADMLLNFEAMSPVDLNKSLTYLWGRETDDFPLLAMTEGMGAVTSKKPIAPGDSQYKWKVAGQKTVTSPVVRLVSTTTKPGLGHTTFMMEMADNWAIFQYGLISPDQRHVVRMQTEGKQTSSGTWVYEAQILSGDPEAYIDLSNFEQGKHWGMAAPSIAGELSTGNRTNAESASELTNQFGWYRFSQQITGNISNLVLDIEFQTESGGTTNKWLPYQMAIWERDRKKLLEEELWFSEYNRDKNGVIQNKEKLNGKPIPKGAGVRDILKSVNNYFTYASMSLDLIDMIINRIYDLRNDNEATPKEIVLYTGEGGKREFQEAIMTKALAKGYYEKLGQEEIRSMGELLSFGRYFAQYKTIGGITVSVKDCNIFNHGTRARMDRNNGRMHKGYPYSSYTMVFLDHTANTKGERNIQLVTETGREFLTGVYKGLTPLPDMWGGTAKQLSTREDYATYEVMCSQGINMLNPTTSFWCELQPE